MQVTNGTPGQNCKERDNLTGCCEYKGHFPMQGFNQKQNLDRPVTYQIKIQGHLDEYWSEWFDDLDVAYDERDNTILEGPVTDQAALLGLLIKAHNLGLPLISVTQIESNSETDQA